MGVWLGCAQMKHDWPHSCDGVSVGQTLTLHGLQLAPGQLDRVTSSLLATDSMEVKPIMTRKLRRRPNDPVPIPDKRRKPAPDIHLLRLEL